MTRVLGFIVLANRIVAAAVAAVCVALVAFDALFLDFFGIFIVLPVALLPLGIVGALLIARIPRNPVGWLLALAGILLEVLFAASLYDWVALVHDPGSLPGGDIAAVLADNLFPPALGSIVLMLMFYPSGRGLGGRWTWIERAIALVAIAVTAVQLFTDAPLDLASPFTLVGATARSIPNPLALRGAAATIVSAVAPLTGSWTVAVVLVGPISLFVRYRRSSELERAQTRWLAYAGTIALALIVVSNLAPPGAVSNGLWAAGVGALGFLPIAVALAIFRYRLYDIDVLIRRTLVYGALSAVLLAAYVGGVALFETVLAPFTSGSGIAVAVSTLAVVALFQPVRSRIQAAVDRRFYRAKYDAERTLDRFAGRLREEVDLDALERELLSAVGETVQPAQASVWLRKFTS